MYLVLRFSDNIMGAEHCLTIMGFYLIGKNKMFQK